MCRADCPVRAVRTGQAWPPSEPGWTGRQTRHILLLRAGTSHPRVLVRRAWPPRYRTRGGDAGMRGMVPPGQRNREVVMSQAGGRLRGLTARLAEWWNSTRKQRSDSTAQLRREAKVRARRAAARMQDFKDSDRGQRAA